MGFGGFSWKRALGLTKAKSRLSRSIGVPLTKGGRQRKFGAALGGGILGSAVGSTGRRSRSAAVRSGGHDDYDDADALVISPMEKNFTDFLNPVRDLPA